MLCFAVGGNIDYRIGLVMAAGKLIGGRLGAYFAMSKGTKLVRPLFLAMMFAAIVTLIYRDDSDWSKVYQLSFAIIFLCEAIFYVWKTKKLRYYSQPRNDKGRALAKQKKPERG